MCVQFYASKIVITTAVAMMRGHDGLSSINADCPVGTCLAYDTKGNCYRYIGPGFDCPELSDLDDARSWPNRTKKGVPLYRDYWRHVAAGANTPYGASVRMAPHKVVA